MAISYSFHLGNKGSSLSTTSSVSGASKHNLRQYKSEHYDKDQIIILEGSQSILDDVKNIYNDTFGKALDSYNEKQTRKDKKIKDYLQRVSDNKNQEVACEIIIQLGDMEFWSDKSSEQKKQTIGIFQDQITELEKLTPDFKIANAVVHLDEASPHMHIVGIPIRNNCKKGLEIQTSKRTVFNQKSLSMLQDKMRKNAEQNMTRHPDIFADEQLKEKEVSHRKDYSKEFLIRQKEKEYDKLNKELQLLEESTVEVKKELEECDIEIKAKIKTLSNRKEEIAYYQGKDTPRRWGKKIDGIFMPGKTLNDVKIEITQAEDQVTQAKTTLNHLNLALSIKSEDLKELDLKTISKKEELEKKELELESKSEDLKELDLAIDLRKKELEKLPEDIKDHIDFLNEEIEKKDKLIHELKGIIDIISSVAKTLIFKARRMAPDLHKETIRNMDNEEGYIVLGDAWESEKYDSMTDEEKIEYVSAKKNINPNSKKI